MRGVARCASGPPRLMRCHEAVGGSMKIVGRVAAVMAMMLLVPATAGAQFNHIRDGFYSTIGLGFGSAKVSCDQCGGGRESGISGLFGIGLAIDQPLIIGAEVDLFYRQQDQDDIWIAALTGFGQWYPVGNGPFFVKAGLGMGWTQVTVLTPTGVVSRSTSGLGYMAAVGYDFRIGYYLSITPIVGIYGGSLGDIEQITGLSTNVIQAGLTVGFF